MTPGRKCTRCESEFVPKDPRQRYCCENCRKRAGDDRGRLTCTRCGGRCAVRTKWSNKWAGAHTVNGVCNDCRRAVEAERIAERDRQLEALWEQGAKQREIAETMGWSVNQVSVEVVYARRRGANLPHRYAMRDGKRVAA